VVRDRLDVARAPDVAARLLEGRRAVEARREGEVPVEDLFLAGLRDKAGREAADGEAVGVGLHQGRGCRLRRGVGAVEAADGERIGVRFHQRRGELVAGDVALVLAARRQLVEPELVYHAALRTA
jgi:hypothetical protein